MYTADHSWFTAAPCFMQRWIGGNHSTSFCWLVEDGYLLWGNLSRVLSPSSLLPDPAKIRLWWMHKWSKSKPAQWPMNVWILSLFSVIFTLLMHSLHVSVSIDHCNNIHTVCGTGEMPYVNAYHITFCSTITQWDQSSSILTDCVTLITKNVHG